MQQRLGFEEVILRPLVLAIFERLLGLSIEGLRLGQRFEFRRIGEPLVARVRHLKGHLSLELEQLGRRVGARLRQGRQRQPKYRDNDRARHHRRIVIQPGRIF